MAMKTTDSQRIADNVHVDLNTNRDMGQGPKLSHEARILLDKSIIARPLNRPEAAEIRIKRTEYRYRWVNFLGSGGRIYAERRAQGFENATTDDVEILVGNVTNTETELRCGDLILMKMQADRYDGAIKANMVKALRLQNMRGTWLEGADTSLQSDATANRRTVNSEPFSRKMAKPFLPGEDEINAKIDDSVASGRVERSRSQVEEFRQTESGRK